MNLLMARQCRRRRCIVIVILLAMAWGPFPASGDLPKEIAAKDGAPMVLVPAGEFWMGLSEEEGLDDEQPRHRVYLDAYYIDQFEVTTERYAKFLAASGWEKPVNWDKLKLPEHATRPVIGVSWTDADAYCRISGRRLPTEGFCGAVRPDDAVLLRCSHAGRKLPCRRRPLRDPRSSRQCRRVGAGLVRRRILPGGTQA